MKMPLLSFLGIAGEYRPIRSLITISGDSDVVIENCRRLIECTDIRCCVLSAGYIIEIWGSGLSASAFANGSAGISGKISSINIERKRSSGEKDI